MTAVTTPTTWGNIREAAQRAGLSEPTIRRYINRGILRAERYGPRLIRVDLRSVDELGTPLQSGGDAQ